jgi:hypothetical protein
MNDGNYCVIELALKERRRQKRTRIIIPMIDVHTRKGHIIYIRFLYMKYDRESISDAINLRITESYERR